MEKNYYKLGTLLLLLFQINLSTAQTNVWGVGSAIGVADAEFANPFVQATTYNAGDNPSSWTALTVSQSDGTITPGSAYWVRSTTGASQGAYWGGQQPIISPSVGNGVALFDSDFMDNNAVAGAFGMGTSPAAHKGHLISPRIDLTGYTNVPLRVFFYEKIRRFQWTELSISFSVDDGASWGTAISFQNIPAVNSVFDGTEALDLTGATSGIANLTQCRLRFTFDGEYYFVMVDDISIQRLCSTTSTISPVVCSSYTSPSGNYTWTASGSYLDTIPNFASCDSVISINLTVQPSITGSQSLTVCAGGSVTVGAAIHSTTGIFADVLTAANGCDSTVTTNLTVEPAITGTQSLSVCAGGSVTVGTVTHTTSGIFTDVLTAADGCDSTVTTNLTVEPVINVTVTTTSSVLTVNQLGATYQWLDCNNSNQAITGAVNQFYIASAGGSYAVEITVGNCVDTSACATVVSVDELNGNAFAVYPNPSTGLFTMNLVNVSKVEITNTLGQLVFEKQLNVGKQEIDLTDVVEGIYFVKVISGKQQGIKRIVISK